MTRNIFLKNKEIKYELYRKNVKNLNLRIKPDGTIYVSANNRISEERIESFLEEHSNFIFDALKKYEEIEKNKPEELKFKTGEYKNLAAATKSAGTVYVTTDERGMCIDVSDTERIRLQGSVL